MKKLLIIFIFLLGFMFMPLVHAEEIPREGVTYFLEYPDGTEDVKETYDEAMVAVEEEKLIFTGQTDSNGQVVLEDIASEGTLRVVQEVPNGYSTDEREVIINLQENKKVEFKNTKGLINPKTGFSILKILLVLAVVITCTIITKKNKKALLVLPLLLLAGLVKVDADSDDLVIDVKDNLGRAQSGVTVKVYAKPTIDAAPAIKYNANGGEFPDGSEIIYVRIPYDGCTLYDFYSNMHSSIDNFRLLVTIFAPFKEGYVVDYDSSNEEPDNLHNGYEYVYQWAAIEVGQQVYTLYLNGGGFKVKGREVNSFKTPNMEIFIDFFEDFLEDSFYVLDQQKKLIGYSFDSSCTNMYYQEYEMSFYSQEHGTIPTNTYLCWSEHPDGLYVNDAVFVGKYERCFNSLSTNSSFVFRPTTKFSLSTRDITSNQNSISENLFRIVFSSINGSEKHFSSLNKEINTVSESNTFEEDIYKMEFVHNGQVVFSASEDDIEKVSPQNGDAYFYISNSEKNEQLNQVFAALGGIGCFDSFM